MMYPTRSNPHTEDGDSNHGATMKQNGIFETQLRAWMSALSPEGRAAALSVKDSAFLFTLMHFASLSSSCGNCSDGTTAGIDGATSLEIPSNCNWKEEFLISDIESVYFKHGERIPMEPSISTNRPSCPSPSLSPVTNTKARVTESETDDGRKQHQLSSRQLSKATDVVVGENDEERIQSNSIGSDAFSIQGETDILSSTELNYPSAFAVVGDKYSESSEPLSGYDDILKKLLLVFPSVVSAAMDHGLRCQVELPQHGDTLVPILSFPPLIAQSFNLPMIPLDACGGGDAASWINVLRVHAEKNASSTGALTASLSRMLLARMQVALTESFMSHKYGSLMNSSDGEEEQSSVEQYTTSREDEESDEVEADECGAEILAIPCHVSSNRVPRKTRHQSSNRADDNARNGAREIIVEEPPFPSVFRLSEVVTKVSTESDLEGLRSIPSGSLPFVPFEIVMRYTDEEMRNMDAALERFLSLTLPRVTDVSAAAEKIMCTHDREAVDAGIPPVQNEGDADDANLEDWQQSLSLLKKKKKKKKKKRKVSNADSPAHDKETASILPVKPVSAYISPAVFMLEATKVVESPDSSTKISPSMETKLDGSVVALGEAQTANEASADVVLAPLVSPTDDTSSVNVPRSVAHEAECTIIPAKEPLSSNGVKNETPVEAEADAEDEDAWETVEAKGKGKNRNKPIESRVRTNHASHNWRFNSAASRKVKTSRTTASRKRHAARKVVRDVLTSLLDSVESEVRRSRCAAEAKIPEERNGRVFQPLHQFGPSASSVIGQPAPSSNPLSMRDVVLGKQRPVATKLSPSQLPDVAKPASSAPCTSEPGEALLEQNKTITNVEVRSKGTQTLSAGADRSTAPTLQETLSGASANTQSSLATDEVDNLPERVRLTGAELVTDDSSSAAAGCDELESNNTKVLAGTEDGSSPPLSTLLGPGNTNSATSSVASSLEAPHTSKHRHHHHHSCNENDVGYHLLDVCDRLSRDMNVFMARRSLALTARRQERGALLSALQNTVSRIWANRGQVEMYGSCATQLDLPSSDLDAVILGLDAPRDVNSSMSKVSMRKQSHRESSMNLDSNSICVPGQSRSQYGHMHPYGRLSSNGERVLILAAELERQAWAVQVKAIPTASVPVVKILADPSKLPGADSVVGSNGNWMIQQHHLAAEAAAAAAGIKPPPCPSTHASRVAPVPQGQSPYPPWRGADVMNGLFSIDITFEGPEHGGIGSTKYSAAVVQDACRETGLPPEGTPLVQVLMVLKELLAQRRLNEPFSGGLSSYALLLLVNAVVKERAIIREEMERIERHRKLVAAEDTAILTRHFEETEDGAAKASNDRSGKRKANGKAASMPKQTNRETSPGLLLEKHDTQKESPVKAPSNEGLARSSWAAIAKKSASSHPYRQSIMESTPETPSEPHGPKSPPSFAEAVIRNKQTSLRQEDQIKLSTTTDPNTEKQPEVLKPAMGAKQTSNVEEALKAKCEHVPTTARSTADLVAPGQTSSQSTPQLLPNRQVKQGVVQHSKTSFASLDASLSNAPSLFPQGSDDVLEVLCSGETSAGKLLMHFLLYYGEHFDSRALAIDVVGNCYPDRVYGFKPPNDHTSPFIPRRAGGTIDPVTGMLTVDPIVVYDPWEGGRGSNVARSCYAWSSIQWHFAQCYMTLSSAVERCGTSITTPCLESSAPRGVSTENIQPTGDSRTNYSIVDKTKAGPPPVDVVSPLLELLLSF